MCWRVVAATVSVACVVMVAACGKKTEPETKKLKNDRPVRKADGSVGRSVRATPPVRPVARPVGTALEPAPARYVHKFIKKLGFRVPTGQGCTQPRVRDVHGKMDVVVRCSNFVSVMRYAGTYDKPVMKGFTRKNWFAKLKKYLNMDANNPTIMSKSATSMLFTLKNKAMTTFWGVLLKDGKLLMCQAHTGQMMDHAGYARHKAEIESFCKAFVKANTSSKK